MKVRTSADDHYRRPLTSLNVSDDWNRCIREIVARDASQGAPVVLVAGPKGSGKSTFCRTLVNAILSRPARLSSGNLSDQKLDRPVAFLDIDPGQPEYSLPGQLSLSLLQAFHFGPPFTHPVIDNDTGNKIVKLQCYGSLSPKDDPAHYIDCVLNLYEMYRKLLESQGHLPLVINSSGWVQGGGLDLLIHIIQILYISDVAYLNSSTSGQEAVPTTLADACLETSTAFHTLTSSSLNIATRTAAELRNMQTLSYFHLAEPEAGNLRWNYTPLQETSPLVLHYTGLQQSILAVMIPGDVQDPNLYETILTGSLVDIVLIDGPAAFPVTKIEGVMDEYDDKVTTPANTILRTSGSHIPYIPPQSPNTRIVRPLNPAHSQSLAQALIHSIDTRNKQLHLLIPPHLILPQLASLDSHSLQDRIVLVKGKMNTPTWAFGETIEREKVRRKRREGMERLSEGDQDLAVNVATEEDDWIEGMRDVPWASIAEGGQGRGEGGRKRRGVIR